MSLPQLGTVDRCVSCHVGIDDPRMASARQPFAAHPGNILDKHPADRFGCAICHHGQGAATSFNEAKAEQVDWEYPLLPPELTESSCFSCHDPDRLPENQASRLTEGIKLYQQKSCGSCHKLGGRGGILGPALDNEGAKTRHQLIMTNLKLPHTTSRWHLAHFRDPGAVVDKSQMKNPNVTEGEALALSVYMLSLWQRDVPASYLAPDKIEQKARALHPQALTGEQIYRQYCFACHGEGTYGRWDKIFKRFIPAIRGISLLTAATPEYLEINISKGRPGTQMPSWEAQAGGIQSEEIAAVQDFLRIGSPAPPSAAALALGVARILVDDNLIDVPYAKEQTDLPLLVVRDTRRFLRESDIKAGGKEDAFYCWDTKQNRAVPLPGFMGSLISICASARSIRRSWENSPWNTPHGRWSIHSTWRDHRGMLRLQRGLPIAYMHPDDAKKQGLVDNDWIRIYNDIGQCICRVQVMPGEKPGRITMYHGWETYLGFQQGGWQSLTYIKEPGRDLAPFGVQDDSARAQRPPLR